MAATGALFAARVHLDAGSPTVTALGGRLAGDMTLDKDAVEDQPGIPLQVKETGAECPAKLLSFRWEVRC